jgi:hypothetical protein
MPYSTIADGQDEILSKLGNYTPVHKDKKTHIHLPDHHMYSHDIPSIFMTSPHHG